MGERRDESDGTANDEDATHTEPESDGPRDDSDAGNVPRDSAGIDGHETTQSGGASGGTRGDGEQPSGQTESAAWTRTDPAEYVTDKRSLSPRIQVLWAVRVGITSLVLGAIASVILLGLDRNPQFGAVVVALVMLLGTVWLVLYYRVWVYQIRDDAIYLERGVVTHVRTLVPYVRIQHVDTSRGPVERLLGLSTLVVYTAGSRGADVSVPGLTPERASDLQQRVKQLAIEAEGDDAL